jgi:hypothetical protein
VATVEDVEPVGPTTEEPELVQAPRSTRTATRPTGTFVERVMPSSERPYTRPWEALEKSNAGGHQSIKQRSV